MWDRSSSNWGQVCGTQQQWIAKIQVVSEHGLKLEFWSSLRKFIITAMRCFFFFFTGPLIAVAGGSAALSMIGLIGAIGFVVVAFFVSLKSPEKAWFFERLGGYRFINREQARQGDQD
jgi:hypothetical protein